MGIKSKRFRKSLRLPDYDYSQAGAYFVTIVTQDRRCLFGDILGLEMILNDAGWVIDQVCLVITSFIPGIRLDCYQTMPDHLHIIIEIDCNAIEDDGDVGATDVEATLRWLARTDAITEGCIYESDFFAENHGTV